VPDDRSIARTIDRTYRVRGKQVHLRELPDVAAVREPRGTPIEARTLSSIAPDAALSHVRAFEQAGWTFVPRQQAADGAKVYLRPNGRVALGTNRLTVRIAPELSEPEARNLLEGEGFTVVQQLRMAPNVFVVAAPEGHDSVEAVGRLTVPDKVEFAEPELIEMIAGR